METRRFSTPQKTDPIGWMEGERRVPGRLATPVLPLLVVLAACSGAPIEEADAGDVDAGDAGPVLDFLFETADDVRLGHAAADLPYVVAYALTPAPFGPPSDCPRLTDTADGWRMVQSHLSTPDSAQDEGSSFER